MLLDINPHLAGKETLERQRQLSTHKGMAYFAGTGPSGAICGECGYWSNSIRDVRPTDNQRKACCVKYRELKIPHEFGPRVPSDALACKYYEPRAGLKPRGL